MNAKTITWYLATRRSSPFYVRKQLAVVPNVSWGLLPWEADLIVCTKTGYLTEVEVKVSMADWKVDMLKFKWRSASSKTSMIKRFYYAAPIKLAQRYTELQLPEGAGVIGIDDQGFVTVLKEAENRKGFRKLTLLESHKLLRLSAIKAWRMSYKPIDKDPSTLVEQVNAAPEQLREFIHEMETWDHSEKAFELMNLKEEVKAQSALIRDLRATIKKGTK